MGGRGENPGLSQVQDDPPTRVLRAVGNARRTLRAGFTTVRNLGLFVKTGGYLLDVALGKAIDAGWIDGPAHRAGRARDHPDRRAPGPDDVRRVHARRARADGRGGHRQRGRRDPQGGALPDQARRPADQGLRLGRRHVADRRSWRATLFGRGAARDRRRGAPARAAGRRAHARRRGGQARGRVRHRLHRARLPDRRRGDPDAGRQRPVPGDHPAAGRGDGRLARRRRSCRPRPPRCSRRRETRSRPPTRPG